MNIEERIKEVDLRPSDIVKLQVPPSQVPPGEEPKKPIDLSQATGWIKNPTATKAIEQLLWRLCDEKVESGLTFSKPGRKKESVVAEIFSEPMPTLIERANPYVEATVHANIRLAKAIGSAKVAEPVLPPLISKSATEKLLAENDASDGPKFNASYGNTEMDLSKIPAKTKNMKKGNPYLEERVIYEGPSTDSAADFIERASKMPINPNTVFRDGEYGSIGDILPIFPSATPTGFPSWGTKGTMKLVGKIMKFNLNDLSYTIDFEKAKSGFLVGGKKYLLSDFTEVK